MLEVVKHPWPWYVAGPIIGLIVPALLLLGNKQFGISANLRHICAACFPAKVPFFQYDWKKEIWNLFFAAGILIGAMIATVFLSNSSPVQPPIAAFNLRGLIMMIGGGFLVGFGARYAGGCTSGHAIMGLSTLQWPSLIATLSFMAGGFLMSNLGLPFILNI